nr:hypothetical protein [Tanacetum cinerariifolium]
MKAITQSQNLDDGFIEVKRKNGKEKLANKPRQVDGICLDKPKPNYFYRHISKSNKRSGDAFTLHTTAPATVMRPAAKGTYNVGKSVETNSPKITPTCILNSRNNIVSIKNSFEALMERVKTINVNKDTWEANINVVGSFDHKSDSKEVENIIIDQPMFMGERTKQNIQHRASTPSNESHMWLVRGWILFVVVCFDSGTGHLIVLHAIKVMHTCVYFKAEKKELFCSFNYAHNRYTLRRNLNMHKHYVRGRPWCLLGDFIVALYLEDNLVGSYTIDIAMREFKECVDGAHAIFQPYRILNHSSVVLKLPMIANSKPHPLKFSNILIHNTRFKDLVCEGWNEPVIGFLMFKVVKKLKFLRKLLCKLLYYQDHGPARCAFKVDIQKAYKTVDWSFLSDIFIDFGFHPRMVTWIMECVSSTSYSISINGAFHGFGFHPRMVAWIMECISSTSNSISINGTPHGYFKGKILVKYLGVLLISTRLLFRDCKELVEKMHNKVRDWKNKSLSVAGRLHLIQYVLSLLHVYWALVFILPSRIMLDLEQLMRGFLWCQCDMLRGKAKVSWESWPMDWYVKCPLLNMYTVPTLIPNTLDRMVWISSNGTDNEFSVSIAWEFILKMMLLICMTWCGSLMLFLVTRFISS